MIIFGDLSLSSLALMCCQQIETRSRLSRDTRINVYIPSLRFDASGAHLYWKLLFSTISFTAEQENTLSNTCSRIFNIHLGTEMRQCFEYSLGLKKRRRKTRRRDNVRPTAACDAMGARTLSLARCPRSNRETMIGIVSRRISRFSACENGDPLRCVPHNAIARDSRR